MIGLVMMMPGHSEAGGLGAVGNLARMASPWLQRVERGTGMILHLRNSGHVWYQDCASAVITLWMM